jgi:DNA-binding SARP family transcriptional activator
MGRDDLCQGHAMRFRVLGQMQVRHGTEWAHIRAAQQRIVLAVLLTDAGRVVSMDRLVHEIWGEHPPRTAFNTIQGYVGRLRRLLPGASLVTRDRGYQLLVADDEVDSRVFERLLEAAQRDVLDGRVAEGADKLSGALALWRGAALLDVPASPTVTDEANRLEQRRLTAVEARAGAELDLGRHEERVDELARQVTEHPLRERLRGHLMLALYRCGRRAEALEVYRGGRELLVAELGIEPGPDLRALEHEILASDQATAAPPAVRPAPVRIVPAELPSDVPGFVGRRPAVDRLDRLLAGGVLVVTVSGTPGVGKTALAVHWAHRVRERFADGQLYMDLRGYSSGPAARPIDVLARFLRALGVPAEQVPSDVDEAAALYRSVLDDRRVLVLLDNARHPEQIRPLLPGTPGCVVLVTSRDVLSGLVARDGARDLRLDLLTEQEAPRLLAGVLDDDRARAEPEALAELAGLCARLPLALRIAAANLAESPHRTVADHVALLRAGDRLGGLAVEGDEQAAVRATFALSYLAQSDDARRLFRFIGLLPFPDITVDAAAALADSDAAYAGRLLARLTTANLISEHAAGRYACHDLLRLYASERAEHEDDERDRAAAVRRVHEWYLRTVDVAASLLYPQMRRLTLPPTRIRPTDLDAAGALAWLDAERHNLVAAITHPAGHRPLSLVAVLADALRGYFWLRMYTVDWYAVAHAGLAAAESSAEPRARIASLLSLADVNFRQGRYENATEYSTRALVASEEHDWAEGTAAAHNNLGNLARLSGRAERAAEHHRRALAINQRIGRLASQANNLGNLGGVYWNLGRLRDALAAFTEALAIARKIGSSHGEAVAVGAVGGLQRDLGNLDDALAQLHQAVTRTGEVGDRGGEVDVRTELAAANGDAGRYPEALDEVNAALSLARDIAYRHGEVKALNTAGRIHLLLGSRADAIELHRRAFALAAGIDHRYGQAAALIGLATARDTEASAASASAEAALELADADGYRVLDGLARTVLAAVRLTQSRFDEALDLAETALIGHRDTGHRLGEARALLVLERLAARTGRAELARMHGHAARALFAEISAPWRDHAAALFGSPVS